jgi:hypothetical protein
MEIQELGTRVKELIGSGLEHQIFGSKINPNVIFKVGHKDTVDEWYDVFKSNPDIFPKVFRIGKMHNSDIYYVELEKLDTKRFESDWDKLEFSLEDIGAVDPDNGEGFSDLYLDNGSDSKIFGEIAINLKKHSEKDFNFFIELLTVIKTGEKAIMSIKNKDTIVDVHKYNFGYGKDGKIKCLDL